MEEITFEDLKAQKTKAVEAAKQLVDKVVGQTLENATKMLKDAGVAMRLVDPTMSRTMEVDEGRVNLQLKHDVVVEASVG